MLFIGGFILAIAAGKTGIDAHLAKVLLKPFGSKSENVLLGFLLITGLFSMFVSNTATAEMMLTFLAPMFKQLPPEGLNLGIGFGEWMMFMFPLVVVLLLLSWFIIKKLYPFTQKTIELKIEGELKHNFMTMVVIVTFILTVALWLLDSVSGINSYTVALVPFMIFSLTGVIDRRDLEEINCKLNVIGGTPTVLISVAVAASSAIVLPISTPPNALAFATNLISQKDMARIGLIIGIMSMVLGISMLYLLGTMHLI
ncbi:MAG: anion permease [Prevotella sp.]|nr:anion permease [Prevotella sp.]